MTKSFNISSAGLRNIVLNTFTEEDDIAMIFGEQEIKMNRLFADFISPVISHHHQSDPTISSFNFSDLFSSNKDEFSLFSKDIVTPDIVSLFQSISSGFSIEIDEKQAFKFRFLSIILGNDELFSRINELFPPDFSEENLEIYSDFIQSCYNFSRFSSDFDFSSLIEYISANFYLLSKEKFLQLPIKIQYLIISNPKLQIANEDSLLDTIIHIINEEDTDNSTEEIERVALLEHIEFTNLSEEKLREFLDIFDFNLMTNTLWKKFNECFFIHFNKKIGRVVNRNSEKKVLEYDENQTGHFEGIIHYLTEKFGGNVVDKGVCDVTSSSAFRTFTPKNAVDFAKHASFSSGLKNNNQWLKIDFLDRKVHPTYYSIQTVGNKKDECHLKSWVLECSNTDKDDDWKVLDTRNNDCSLNNSGAVKTFQIQTNLNDNESFRFLRLRQTGLNWKGTNQLAICYIEFFGTIC